MRKIDVSLITIANDRNVLEDFLDNLKKQKEISYELIVIDNYNKEYNSARKAYNEHIERAHGEYIVFLHPDIRFLTEDCLYEICNYAKKIGEFGVIGVAGASFIKSKFDDRIIYTSIKHGKKKIEVGNKINKPIEVQTVDECFFLIKKENIISNKFSNKEGWHLYAVEYCLNMKYIQHKKNYAIPASIWHLSDGKSLDPSYVTTLKELIKEYKGHVEYISTTVKKWYFKSCFFQIYITYFYLKQVLKKKVRIK